MAQAPMSAASAASASQVASHAREDECREATKAATSADRPMTNPPQPGTAVKDAERSIVWRMNRRSAIAWAPAAEDKEARRREVRSGNMEG
ncbi:MAG: hypothetical protein DMG23_02600 [Acidobacteria bacterium]|nr:MAG: hypothetical protein DMG23_02600 [Acidobacteriota bacterium]